MNDGEVFRQLESRATKAFALVEDPPVFVSGSGVRLTASDGRQYLDFAAGSGTSNVGHGNPAVMAAVRELLDRGLTHVGPHFHADVQADFYQLLRKQLPAELTRLHPATNGTEATEAALKACMHATGARRFLAFEGGYHGRTLGSLAVSHARGSNAGLAPLAPEAEFIPYPQSAEDISLAVRTVGERPPGEPPLAGVIVEPIQATGGILLPPVGFLSALAATARSALVPLIVDEIFTGMGRTGPVTITLLTRAGFCGMHDACRLACDSFARKRFRGLRARSGREARAGARLRASCALARSGATRGASRAFRRRGRSCRGWRRSWG